MSSGHRFGQDALQYTINGGALIPDPGDGNQINLDRNFGICELTIGAGAETRTLPDPTVGTSGIGIGTRLLVVANQISGGSCTLEGASFTAEGQHADFVVATVNGSLVWVDTSEAGVVTSVDLDGAADALILDADGDTTISAPTDDQIDVEIAGADDFRFTANTFTALSGSVFKTDVIQEASAGLGVTVDTGLILDGAFCGIQGTPAAKTGVATIAAADIKSGIVTLTQSTGATVALTLDTGADMDLALFPPFGTNQYIDWTLINLSAAAIDTGTLTASAGHTIVGNPIVASSHATTVHDSSARFRSRRTGADTWITYRIA